MYIKHTTDVALTFEELETLIGTVTDAKSQLHFAIHATEVAALLAKLRKHLNEFKFGPLKNEQTPTMFAVGTPPRVFASRTQALLYLEEIKQAQWQAKRVCEIPAK
jgi:hypothetical protein